MYSTIVVFFVSAGFTDLLSQVCVNPAANSAYSELTGAFLFDANHPENGGGNHGIQILMMFDDV